MNNLTQLYSMDGQKTNSSQPDANWYGFQVFTSFNLIAATYIFTALMRYEFIHGKFKCSFFTSSFAMKFLVISCSLYLMVCSVTTQVSLLVAIGSISNKLLACAASSKLHALVTTMGLISTYIFLWFRQNAFYKKLAIQQQDSKTILVVNRLTIILIIFCFIGYVTVFTKVQLATFSTNVGCTFLPKSELLVIVFYVLAALGLLTIIILFGLFLYPLVTESRITLDSDSNRCLHNRHDLNRTIRISIISLVACIISDVPVFLLENVWKNSKVPSFYVASFYDFSLLFNVLAMVFTYDKSVEILFGWSRSCTSEIT